MRRVTLGDGRLAGRPALVTGAGAGIGRAIVLRLADEGAPVAVADINQTGAEETVRLVREGGGTAEAFALDLASVESIAAVVDAVLARFGRIAILVNNAGINGNLPLLEVTPEEWDRINGVNARGTFFCLQAVARRMQAAGEGRIVSISSIAAKGFPRSGSVAYAVSKSAVIAMTRFAALHLGPHGITVNAICPGPTRSDAFADMARAYAAEQRVSLEDAYRRLDEFIPLRRSNEPRDIAAMAAFLASDDARNITGQSFNVDGGLTWD
jgi:NAD(P)-dependent dehydrogenase (short-subunit alcohol dehydrogenase family)